MKSALQSSILKKNLNHIASWNRLMYRWVFTLLFLLAGCAGGENEPSEDPNLEPWLELGAGLYAYEELEDGDSIELVHGFQGGWHVDMSLRFGDFGPGGIQLTYQATDSSSGDLISYVTQTTLRDSQVDAVDTGWERYGDRIVFDIESAYEVVDRDVQLEVMATLDDVTLSDSRIARVRDNDP
jgi:hypothetical protein